MQQEKIDLYKNYTSTTVLAGVDEAKFTQWSIGNFCASIGPHLPPKKDVSILEIGCGYGRNIKALAQLGYSNVRGIDISEEQIAYASTRLGLTNVAVTDAMSFLTNSQETYDVILLLDVLEHLDNEYAIRLTQLIRSSLNPGGVFVVQVPNAMSPLSPLRYGDITHLRAYTAHSMDQHLRLSGFTEMQHFELPAYVHGPVSLIRRILWGGAIKPLISAYMLIANGDLMGGIYTCNMLTVIRNR